MWRKHKKYRIRNVTIGIIAIGVAIVSVFLGGLLLNGAERIEKFSSIGIIQKQVEDCAVDVPYIIKSVPDRSASEYEFAGKNYKMFCQFSKQYKGYNDYLRSHGCTVTTLTAILRAYAPECSNWTPYETITIAERKVAGEDAFKTNYSKELAKQMPFTFLGATQILDLYGVKYEYEPYFESDEEAKEDIIEHLYTGRPVMFVIGQKNRETNKKTNKWTGSYHTMLMIGTDGKDNILIGNPAGGQRFQMVTLDEMINYMWSCTAEPSTFYWKRSGQCGGYIKILE